MCNQTVGVAKRIEVEKISKEVAELIKTLDEEIKLDVKKVKEIQNKLEKVIAEKQ